MLESERRRQSVLRIYDALTAGRLHVESDDVLETIFSPEARHHRSSQPLSDGPAGARQLYLELQTRLPGVVATVKRTVSDDEFVAVHWHASTDPRDEFSGESWCEFFRFVGDQVAEHWQLHVAVPSSTVSGRSVFSDAYQRTHGTGYGEAAMTAINREVASAAFARFIEFDHTVVADHWGEVYLQHNETIPDGPEAIRRSLEETGGLPDEFRPSFTVVATVAEGDLVWFLERVRVGNQTGLGVDILRLVDRRIVEHWDIPALRPGSVDAGQ
ncbi:nuclear transport factor 2 family protein [Streptomyces jeddahensis]|uniref:SnoaL-like domain protein n=1 Tax=Streptomyces jeddahensis TaxID=1716141 RepID=A0A177HM52_9ACTN|nr:nuclear transport factor 2 family protein [Streptomyces jeddahensis]OAH11487.1 snoaL-like domain protein [Streptomyces jeddahensis]